MENLLSIEALQVVPGNRMLCLCTDDVMLASTISESVNNPMPVTVIQAILEGNVFLHVVNGIAYAQGITHFQSEFAQNDYKYAFPVDIDTIYPI